MISDAKDMLTEYAQSLEATNCFIPYPSFWCCCDVIYHTPIHPLFGHTYFLDSPGLGAKRTPL